MNYPILVSLHAAMIVSLAAAGLSSEERAYHDAVKGAVLEEVDRLVKQSRE
jgi:hypothetical protein